MPTRGLSDRVDRLLIRHEVALRVFLRYRGFAEYVVGIAGAPDFEPAHAGQCLKDDLADDELLAHQAHRHVHTLADQRFVAPVDDARECLRQPGFIICGDQLTRQWQALGSGVHG